MRGSRAAAPKGKKSWPVSILPVLSKILERAVNDQLNAYLTKKGLLHGFQGFSTKTCLLNLCDHVKEERSKGNFTRMILIDLQKAFDCVDHGLLIDKLSTIGVGSID